MAQFIVERHLPGITPEQLTGAARAMTQEGSSVTYLRSTFVPQGERCFCLFEAGDSETVQKVNDRAGLPYTNITHAMHLASADLD